MRSFIAILLLAAASPAEAGFADWWLTPDQQAMRAYQAGDYARAAQRFSDPYWKGLAYYAAGDFATAAAVFAEIESPEALFYLGNARAHQGDLPAALSAWDELLQEQPDNSDARFNRDWVAGILNVDTAEYEDAGGTGGKLGADKIEFSDRASNAQGEMTQQEARRQGLSDEQLEAMWMRRVQTTPGDFLALKFSYQLQAEDSDDTP